MNKSRIIVALAFALVASNGFWVYTLLDQSVSLTHTRESDRRSRDALQTMNQIFERLLKGELTRDKLRTIGGELQDEDTVVKEKGNLLIIDGLRFEFQDGLLVECRLPWDTNSGRSGGSGQP